MRVDSGLPPVKEGKMAVRAELLQWVDEVLATLPPNPPGFEVNITEHPGGSIYIYAGIDTIRISDHNQPEGRTYGDAPIADIRVKRGLGRTAQRQLRSALRRAARHWIETPD